MCVCVSVCSICKQTPKSDNKKVNVSPRGQTVGRIQVDELFEHVQWWIPCATKKKHSRFCCRVGLILFHFSGEKWGKNKISCTHPVSLYNMWPTEGLVELSTSVGMAQNGAWTWRHEKNPDFEDVPKSSYTGWYNGLVIPHLLIGNPKHIGTNYRFWCMTI